MTVSNDGTQVPNLSLLPARKRNITPTQVRRRVRITDPKDIQVRPGGPFGLGENAQDARRESDGGGIMAFITVQPSLLGEHQHTGQLAQHQSPGVTVDSRRRETRQVGERNRACARQLFAECTQTRTEDDGDGRRVGGNVQRHAHRARALERQIRPARHRRTSVQEKGDERLIGTRRRPSRVI